MLFLGLGSCGVVTLGVRFKLIEGGSAIAREEGVTSVLSRSVSKQICLSLHFSLSYSNWYSIRLISSSYWMIWIRLSHLVS